MYFKQNRYFANHFSRLLIFVSFFMLNFALIAQALSAELSMQKIHLPAKVISPKLIFTATPEQCVALHPGRTCYATIKLTWQTNTIGNFCVYREKNPLQCWQDSNQGTMSYIFESDQNITFTLKDQQQKEVIINTEVKVSWVHKATPRTRRWRIF